MSGPKKYRSIFDGEVVEAHQIPKGKRQAVEDSYGEAVIAQEGDYVIFSPYTEVVDQESFELEYKERENAV